LTNRSTIPSADTWRPAVALEILQLRADLLAEIRAFFAARGVLEVDTPALASAAVTDPHLESFVTHYRAPGQRCHRSLYLQTSPEFFMKRLLASGSHSIYQIAKVFRNGELGHHHNPEFSLLEWYRLGFDHHRLMDEVAELLATLLKQRLPLLDHERLSYREVFRHYLDLDPHRTSVAELKACALDQDLTAPPRMPSDDPNPWLDLLLSHCIAPELGRGRLTFIYDYPASQAALARVRAGSPPLAERFELYLNGLELANGFHELTDAKEQARRFVRDNRLRRRKGLTAMPIDRHFLAALTAGLPDCAGVALGIDRLLMLAAGKTSLAEVIAFPSERV
jgi:lysyl-tRNA synthetase class 2